VKKLPVHLGASAGQADARRRDAGAAGAPYRACATSQRGDLGLVKPRKRDGMQIVLGHISTTLLLIAEICHELLEKNSWDASISWALFFR